MIDLADPFLQAPLQDEFFLPVSGHCNNIGMDFKDYVWAIGWKWKAVWNNGCRHKYVRRNTWRNGKRITLFLHKEIMKRQQPVPPNTHHTIADHIDGNTLDCHRDNLRWATPRMNAMNNKRSRAQHV